MTKIRPLLLLGLLLLAVAGCSAATENSARGDNALDVRPTVTLEPSSGGEGTSAQPTAPSTGDQPSSEAVRRMALEFLAAELGASASGAEVVRFAEREWQDSALECAVDNDQVNAMLTPGYHLLAKAQGRQYDVRTNIDGSQILLCAPTTETGMDDSSPETTKAREFLAEELGDSADSFVLVEKRPVTWRDGSLGCPVPDGMYVQALTEGYQFIFERDGERYFVHTDQNLSDLILCPDPEEPYN